MAEATREYHAIVWIQGSETPPERLALQARDKAEAERLIRERFGERIFKCSVWNEEELAKTWTRPKPNNALREFKAIVWTKDPATPGQRMTVHARSLDEARKLVEGQFTEEITCSIWNEEDANRTR